MHMPSTRTSRNMAAILQQIPSHALNTPLGFSCLFTCFISGYVTIRHIFGIDHAIRFCSERKTTKWRKLLIALELVAKSSYSRSQTSTQSLFMCFWGREDWILDGLRR